MSLTAVCRVERHSPAGRAGVRVGETLTHVNGKPIVDVLDYKFYTYDPRLELTLKGADGTVRNVRVRKMEGEESPLSHGFAMPAPPLGEPSCEGWPRRTTPYHIAQRNK